MHFKRFAAMATSVVLAVVTLSFGQMETATLSGKVTDQKGAVVPGAQLSVTNVETNISVRGTTNQLGLYVMSSLRPGHYRVTVSKEAFKTINLTDLVLTVQDAVSRNFELQVGSASESVTVVADAADVRMSPAVNTVVDKRLVGELPLNGRSFQALFQLTPGVTITPASFNDQGQFSVNGQRTNANYFMIDGASANVGIAAGFPPGQSFGGSLPALTASGGTNGLVSTDAVQEFAIETSSYAPEFGRTPGGQMSVVTRSGTNEFHGDVFDYLRNDVFDANDWLANQKGLKRAALRQNDFGGTLSGPLRRNKTFFFLSYEGLRLRQPTTGLSDVPTVAVRASAPPPVQPYMQAFPLPTGADEGNGLAPANYSFSNPTQLDAGSLRLDHHVNNSLSLFARYNYASSDTKARGGSFSLSTVADSPFSVQTLTAGATYAITPRLADEVRFNWSRSSADSVFGIDNFGGAVPLVPKAVFPPGVDLGNSEFFFLIADGQNSQFGLGPNVKNRQGQINLIDNLSWQMGAHLLKLGLDYRRLTPSFDPAGYFQDVLVNDVATLVSGTVNDAFLQSSAGVVHGGLSNYSLYVQDTWKPYQRLSIDYGLRWDYNPAPTAKAANGQRPLVLENTTDFSAPSFAPAGSPLYDATKNNFAPRIGFAYEIRESSKAEAVIRAGFGVFYDLGNGVVGTTFAFYPFVAFTSNFNPQPFPLTPDAAAPPSFSSSPPFSTIQAFPRTLKQPYTYHWNLSYQQALGAKQSITLGYIGAAGHSLIRGLDVFSPPLPSDFTEIRFVTNGGYSNYNSFQTVFRRQAAQGLEVLASYTLSHSLDNSSSDQGLNPPGQFVNPSQDYGSSDFDIRHTASAALDYELPNVHGSRVVKAIVGGWGINGILTARSAPPVNIAIERFLSFGSYSFRPDRVVGAPLYIHDATVPGGSRFNAAALSDPVAPVQGDLGRNEFRGFPLAQVDLSIRRRFRLTERLALQARVEAFNILNHPNFAPPSGFLGFETAPGQVAVVPGFGISQSMLNQGLSGFGAGFNPLYQIGGPRSVQLALKLEF